MFGKITVLVARLVQGQKGMISSHCPLSYNKKYMPICFRFGTEMKHADTFSFLKKTLLCFALIYWRRIASFWANHMQSDYMVSSNLFQQHYIKKPHLQHYIKKISDKNCFMSITVKSENESQRAYKLAATHPKKIKLTGLKNIYD